MGRLGGQVQAGQRGDDGGEPVSGTAGPRFEGPIRVVAGEQRKGVKPSDGVGVVEVVEGLGRLRGPALADEIGRAWR